MKTFVLLVLIAAATGLAIFVLRKQAPDHADLSELSRNLRDPNWQTRQGTATELTAKSSPASLRTLLSAAREEHPAVRATIHNALLSIRERGTREWLTKEGLAYPDRWVRFYAVKAIATEKGPACVDVLLPHLEKNAWQVQLAILEALSQHRSPAAIDRIAGVSTAGHHWQVRLEAIRILGALDSPEGVRHLLTTTLPESPNEADANIERAVEDALGTVTQESALGLLTDQMTGNASPGRRLVAIKAAGRARHAKALTKLQEIASSGEAAPLARVAALRSAVQAGGEAGVQFVIDFFPTADAEMKMEAAGALREATLTPAAATAVKGLAEKETDWRLKQALLVATEPR